MAEYQIGDVVDITIKDARIVDVCRHGDGNGDDLRFTYEAKDGEAWPSAVWAHAPGVFVERVAPAEWPPRPGDLWRDRHGNVWFAADLHDIAETDSPEIYMLAAHEDHQAVPDRCNENFGPLTLVHRENDEQDEADRG